MSSGHGLDQLQEMAQGMYLEPRQADDFWFEIEVEYCERLPEESTGDYFWRLFQLGFIPINNRTWAFVVDVKKLAQNLGKSQRWIHDWLDNIFYYRIQPSQLSELAWEFLHKDFGEYATILEENQHDWQFYQLQALPRALRGRPPYKRLNRV